MSSSPCEIIETFDELSSSSLDNDSAKQFRPKLERNAISISTPTTPSPIVIKRLSSKSNKRYPSKFKKEYIYITPMFFIIQ